LLCQHLHPVVQCAVERLIGDRFGHQIGDRDAHRPQEQQRDQYPVEDFAEQRTLYALFRLGVEVGGRCRRSRIPVVRGWAGGSG